MFANTLTITIDGTAHVLTRVNQDNFGSVYVKRDPTFRMTLQFRNSEEKASKAGVAAERHNMFFEHVQFATPTAIEKSYTASAVFRLTDGADSAYLDKLATGFITLLTAQKTGLIGWES